MGASGKQATEDRRYWLSIDAVIGGDLLDAVRRHHRWDVIAAYLVGRGIVVSKREDPRDPISYYEWDVPAADAISFEAGLDRVDWGWRDFLRVS